MNTNLVLQSFGNEREYLRAALAIWSYFAFTDNSVQTNVHLFTDDKDYLHPLLNGLDINYIHLTEANIKKYRGDIDFVHRMKIEIINEAFNFSDDSIIYIDSDTFFINDPSPLFSQVSPRTAFMHVPEYAFREIASWNIKNSPMKVFVELIKSQNFLLSNGTSIDVSLDDFSWNAGVMIFHKSHQRYIPDIFALTEQFYPSTKCHASEQYAFSLILQKNVEVLSCFDSVYHYWEKEKKQLVDNLMPKFFTAEWMDLSYNKKLEAVKNYIPKIFT